MATPPAVHEAGAPPLSFAAALSLPTPALPSRRSRSTGGPGLRPQTWPHGSTPLPTTAARRPSPTLRSAGASGSTRGSSGARGTSCNLRSKTLPYPVLPPFRSRFVGRPRRTVGGTLAANEFEGVVEHGSAARRRLNALGAPDLEHAALHLHPRPDTFDAPTFRSTRISLGTGRGRSPIRTSLMPRTCRGDTTTREIGCVR